MFSEERGLIRELENAKTDEERARVIKQLEAVPEKFYSFSDRWMIIHDGHRFEAWTDQGFDASLVDLPEIFSCWRARLMAKRILITAVFTSSLPMVPACLRPR